eukprot:CAMPEP_0182469706 /NCGR_PEP_ID=MMETSP1319-20130603/17523_1 /TAXON_ID=172717 /ORGANISM="Bolidomonas pacifica, Strain RCC208" /LENGTH=44 /DNA_ID= /DNA_START= /DNA_END= /DNA_ORIENTATION=
MAPVSRSSSGSFWSASGSSRGAGLAGTAALTASPTKSLLATVLA